MDGYPEIIVKPDEMWIHPGNSQGPQGLGLVVISYLSPVDQTVKIDYSFALPQNSPNRGASSWDGVDYFVDLGDSSGNLVNGSLPVVSSAADSLIVSLGAGDRVNFGISSRAGGYFGDSTIFSATISNTVPAPATLALLGLGLLGLHARRLAA